MVPSRPGLPMETELVREYASRMARVFADRLSKAKRVGETQDYLKLLEGKRDFWARVAQLPPNSEYWELVTQYLSLMSDPRASKSRIRDLYKFLEKTINPDNRFQSFRDSNFQQ